jgi:hypothetical protein
MDFGKAPKSARATPDGNTRAPRVSVGASPTETAASAGIAHSHGKFVSQWARDTARSIWYFFAAMKKRCKKTTQFGKGAYLAAQDGFVSAFKHTRESSSLRK